MNTSGAKQMTFLTSSEVVVLKNIVELISPLVH